jgi:hydroxyacylglutathione hydrolase
VTQVQVTAIPALSDNYIWAIIHQDKAVIVDPGEAEPVERFLKQHHLSLAGILLTHHHWDHTNGAAALHQRYHVPVFGPAEDHIPSVTHALRDGDSVKIPDFPIVWRVMAIPGHTLGHVAYYADGMLFCGDTLFSAGCGRLFEGTAQQMYDSLSQLAALPCNTRVYCGHEYTVKNLQFAQTVEPENTRIVTRLEEVQALRNQQLPSLPSTIKIELETNPFLRCDSPEVFAALRRLKDTL